MQIADALIPHGDNRTGETVEFSSVAFETLDMDYCPDLRDPQDFKNGVWYELRKKCPYFFGILERQYPPEPVSVSANYNGYKTSELDLRLVLAFLGRLLVPLNVYDKYQKALAVIGASGVGKTKLLEFMTAFVQGVFNLKNNPEEMFGFETAIGKNMCIVEEISSKSNIPGDMMLSIICGTKALPVSRKNKGQFDMPFNMPIVICGNSFPAKWPNEVK
jgi:hypothetical protein